MKTSRIVAEFANRLALLMVLVMFFAGVTEAAAQGFKFIEVKVIDENGKPMANVPVNIKMDGLEFPMPTDELGMISLNVPADDTPLELRVRQEGYELQRIRWRRGSEVPAEYSLKMELGKPGQGWVVDALGDPVADAEVFTAPPNEWLTFVNGQNPPDSKQMVVKTDEQGKFALPFQPEGSTIACLSDAGWTQLMISKRLDDQALELKLTPWVRVQLMSLGKRNSNDRGGETVGLHFVRAVSKDQGKVKWLYRGVTDKLSEFNCDRVIPGSAMAYREAPLKVVPGQPVIVNRSHGLVVDLKLNVRTQVLIGNAKPKVKGTLILPVDYVGEANWESGYVVLTENNVINLALRTAVFEYGKLLSQSNVYDPNQRVPPSGQPNYLVRYLSAVQPDGSFEIEGVPPGQYKFSAVLTAQPTHDRSKMDVLSVENIPFTVTAEEGKSEQIYDLGDYILEHKLR